MEQLLSSKLVKEGILVVLLVMGIVFMGTKYFDTTERLFALTEQNIQVVRDNTEAIKALRQAMHADFQSLQGSIDLMAYKQEELIKTIKTWDSQKSK